jgi:hypothetical protein
MPWACAWTNYAGKVGRHTEVAAACVARELASRTTTTEIERLHDRVRMHDRERRHVLPRVTP